MVDHGVNTVFHYLPLHKSEYYLTNHKDETLTNAEKFADCLVRLPLHINLTNDHLDWVINCIVFFIALESNLDQINLWNRFCFTNL